MEISKLGDALDFWKGEMLSRMDNAGLLCNLKIDPMIYEPQNNWGINEQTLYSNLLSTPLGRIDFCFRPLDHSYFENYEHPDDMFLDPDVGIEPPASSSYKRKEHVKRAELNKLLTTNPHSMIIVFQHANRGGSMFEKSREVCGRLFNDYDFHIYSCICYARQAAMIFLSRCPERMSRIMNYFQHQQGFNILVNRLGDPEGTQMATIVRFH